MDAVTLQGLRQDLTTTVATYRHNQGQQTPAGDQMAYAAEELLRALDGQPTRGGKPFRVTFQYEGHRPVKRPFASVDQAVTLLRETMEHGAHAVLSIRNDETGGHDDFGIKTLIAMGYVSLTEHEELYGLEG
jgi:hypothetical protein